MIQGICGTSEDNDCVQKLLSEILEMVGWSLLFRTAEVSQKNKQNCQSNWLWVHRCSRVNIILSLNILKSSKYKHFYSKWQTSPPVSPGEWDPGEGKRRPEEGGEAADRGGQVPVVRAEQPRTPLHRPDSSDPRPPVPSSSQQLPPPAHHCTTLPALTRRSETRRQQMTDLNVEKKDWLEMCPTMSKE